MQQRRQLIKAMAAAGLLGTGALAFGRSATAGDADGSGPAGDGGSPLNILILGGTGFIGPHMVRQARDRGHVVTLFNRGKTNADLFPDVETLIGDRDGQLAALEGRQWDAVVDNSGYVPRHVSESAGLLSGAAPHYLFISSISAYADFSRTGIDEDHPVATMPDESVEEVTGATYGPMKALCEKAVWQAYPHGTTIIRPGFIVGPGDRSDRFTYWPVRVARGGPVLAPGSPEDPIQIIDARDLAGFVIQALENRVLGTYNAAGPVTPLAMGEMLETMRQVSGSDATFRWVDAETLGDHDVSVPIWAPPTGDTVGVHRISNARAIAAGLSFRPLATTVSDTLQWWRGLDEDRRNAMRSGLRMIEEGRPQGFNRQPMSLQQQMASESRLLEMLQTENA